MRFDEEYFSSMVVCGIAIAVGISDMSSFLIIRKGAEGSSTGKNLPISVFRPARYSRLSQKVYGNCRRLISMVKGDISLLQRVPYRQTLASRWLMITLFLMPKVLEPRLIRLYIHGISARHSGLYQMGQAGLILHMGDHKDPVGCIKHAISAYQIETPSVENRESKNITWNSVR